MNYILNKVRPTSVVNFYSALNQINSIPLMPTVNTPPDQNTKGHQPDAPENVANKVSSASAGDTQRDKDTQQNEDRRDDPQP